MTTWTLLRASVLLAACLPLLSSKGEKTGSVSGRVFLVSPDGKEIPASKAKVYLLYEGGKPMDVTGLRTQEELQNALKTPSSFFNDERSREMAEYMKRFMERSRERMKQEISKDVDAALEGGIRRDENAECLEQLAMNQRAMTATEKWVAENRRLNQFFRTETSPEGKFEFLGVPEGNYYLVALGSAGEQEAHWHKSITVKSRKDVPLPNLEVLKSCQRPAK